MSKGEPVIVESHFTGTGNFDRVLSWVHDDIQLMRAFDCDANAREVIRNKYQIVGNDVLWARDYGRADLIIGSPPCQLYSVSGSGIVLGMSFEWLTSLQRIRQARPTWIVYEGFTGAPWREVREMLEKLGYVVSLCTVRAYECGAPHVHGRVFLLAAKEPLFIEKPSYKRYRGSMIPTPTQDMNTSATHAGRKPLSNLRVWISKNLDEQTWPIDPWFQVIGWKPNLNDSIDNVIESVGEWLNGFTNHAISKYHFSHRTACRLIGNATIPQQAHVGLWRSSLEVNRLLA